jgi:hypothetical protein
MSILVSQKCQEDPLSRDSTKTASWANKQAKKAVSQLRGALRTAKSKAIWCNHRRRGRVEFHDGLPTIDHSIVIIEVFESVELGPANDLPLEFDGTPITYLSVNDFLNLAVELRTLPELLEYLAARRLLASAELRVVGDEKPLFEFYLLKDGSLHGCGGRAHARIVAAENRIQLEKAKAAKAESDHYGKLLEYVADQLATRHPDYASELPERLVAGFDGPAERKNYLEMQEVLASLRLRERAELGRAFDATIRTLRDEQEGFTYRSMYFDPQPDWVFVLASSKGTKRAEVLERGLILTRAAMAHYGKSRCMLITDRDGLGFEIAIGTMSSAASSDELAAGKHLFGNLKMASSKYSFVPETAYEK